MKDLYQYSHYNCLIGKQYSCDLAKMDPNTKLFILHDGKTYDNYGSKMFCCKQVRQVLRNLKKHLRSLYSVVMLHVLACAQFRIANEKTKQKAWWEDAI